MCRLKGADVREGEKAKFTTKHEVIRAVWRVKM